MVWFSADEERFCVCYANSWKAHGSKFRREMGVTTALRARRTYMNALNYFAKEVVDCSRIAEVFGELALVLHEKAGREAAQADVLLGL